MAEEAGEAMTAEQIALVRELRGEVCRCGERKTPMQTFCKGCYFALPRLLRQRLYDRVGEGYEEAYQAAAGWLDAKRGLTTV
jgi:hypothetical protein